MKIRIGNKKVGDDEPCFIIAEAGVNHNGDLRLAKKLVDAAKKAGADAIKFQTFKAEGVVAEDAPTAEYQRKNTGRIEPQRKMLARLELEYDDFCRLKEYCDRKKIIFLSTPHSSDAIDFLDDIVPAYKFGSGDLTNIPALEHAAKKGKPIILGTGMSTLKEVEAALDAIHSQGNQEIIALHCTTNYPCPAEEVNLRAMLTMKEKLDCIVGFSDHTLGHTAAIIATALGAAMIEKHLTLDRKLPGPDHKASLEPNELREMVQKIREAEIMLGSGTKEPTDSEKRIMAAVRKSLTAARSIGRGEKITEEMLATKRPGTGISPSDIKKLIGKTASKNIRKDEIIDFKMIK
jgi:N-acetylneuraminate synthase/N,N'-diacetyllegionaminate synthase